MTDMWGQNQGYDPCQSMNNEKHMDSVQNHVGNQAHYHLLLLGCQATVYTTDYGCSYTMLLQYLSSVELEEAHLLVPVTYCQYIELVLSGKEKINNKVR